MRLLPLLFALPVLAAADSPPLAPAPPAQPSPGEIVAGAPASAWLTIPADDLLVMKLANGHVVTIQLAPAFAPVHVANIRALAKAGWFAGTSVNRVQDNYVVQWGDATEKKPLPKTVIARPPAEYERAIAGLAIDKMSQPDSYAPVVGHVAGLPVGADPASASVWLAHCYGMVGVGRDMPPDTGTGAELYVVIGQAPRHLDRNITVVGRVIDGIEWLSALPRGTGELGFYKTTAERTGIAGATLASDLPVARRPRFEAFRTDTPSFDRYAEARANRRDAFFVRAAGAAELCNVPAPVRRVTP